MATHQVTLALPESVYRLAEQTASVTHRSIETMLIDALAATFPPINDLPDKIKTEVTEFVVLEDEILLTIASEMLSLGQQEQITQLLNKNSEETLTEKEQAKLKEMMDEYWRVTLRKSQAKAILAQRAQKLKQKGGQCGD